MVALDESEQKAFDFAQELTKQVITLAIAIITVTISFLKDIVADAPKVARVLLATSWGVYTVSITFGVLTLMALVGNLGAGTTTVSTSNVVSTSLVQHLAFILAVILTVVAAVIAL